ncbi:prepilin-type N-terminal cleavage/methylation domain-containing protein [Glaciecola petra]|uniref:Prepilin-type N-terminal cleavage/methylation domain-containing protein n=1 Tax=Glaciecola petra TaxID=3075602 RepID=A0ABU2ZRL0_9ALTE|nr:prepilin-type N-terminal cleavage/methylation domain-containing protein [Aestuariibacter sp. P117]MDT0595276.1 prepilin-type N-terminal cleavage/methylation domain-containing protein [Aestuariibacter sp. P117]
MFIRVVLIKQNFQGSNSGFTLVELIIVIVIVGILAVTAAPRFINFSEDANIAVVETVGGTFATAIKLAHFKWQIAGGSGPIDNLDVYGTGENTLDINANGWPAQSYIPFETNPRLDNTNDCMSVWRAVLDDNSPTVSTSTNMDFQVSYSSNTCTYALVDQPELSIFYDSNTGTVTVDSTP